MIHSKPGQAIDNPEESQPTMHHHRSNLSVRRAPSRDLSSRSSREDEAASPSLRIRIAAADSLGATHSDDDSGCIVDEYAWLPSGVRPDTVHAYFSSLPAERVPLVGSSGAKWRLRQLRHQLPPHDSDPAYCGHLKDEDEVRQLAHFDKRRQEECLGRGTVQLVPYDRAPNCAQCTQPLQEDSVGVWAERVRAWYHPACFVCHSCRELLVDLVYFKGDLKNKHESSIYCGRHHAEQFRPRCARCDELIFSSECAEAEGHSYHMEHLRCAQCDCPLGGHHYARAPNGQIVCSSCRKLPACAGCSQMISPNEASINQGDQQWHATHRCFRCGVCQRSLLGHPFALSSPSSSSTSSLRCSPACPKSSSRSMEHIYETVMSECSSLSSPFSPRRRLHPSHSERNPLAGFSPISFSRSPAVASPIGDNHYECLRPTMYSSIRKRVRRSTRGHNSRGWRSEIRIRRRGGKSIWLQSKQPSTTSPKHLPYAQKKSNSKCIVS
ncbi:prkl-1 [Pristionchus pacificus]|uniref:LIM domain containing protein n=1 Tax=Pristionchus pacificus TaxID=54126 RepID=A0A2A6BY94_PRIPA|nr:prkl-1 [Pristionchus pacificus]|eukprot:PDM70787.1 LIM domain containing protein [Pristionchus pacificus]